MTTNRSQARGAIVIDHAARHARAVAFLAQPLKPGRPWDTLTYEYREDCDMKTYNTIIAGSRTIEHIELVEKAIQASGFRITEVISGGAAGADLFGEEWAKRKMIPIRRFPADWRTHGKAAGPIRNDQMARAADQLIAVWDGVSRGTRDMIDLARHYGLTVFVYDYGETR